MVDWSRDQWGGYLKDRFPASVPQHKSHPPPPPTPQNKMSAKSTLHCTDDRMHQSFSLALNPLGYVEGFCAALEWQSFRNPSIQPTEKKHFSITACPLVSDSPLCGSREPPHSQAIHLVFEKWAYGWQKRMKKRLTKDKLWVLKWRGLWKVSHRRHSHHCKEKYVPKKIKKCWKVSCFAKTQLSSQDCCCREEHRKCFYSAATLLYVHSTPLSTVSRGERVHVHKKKKRKPTVARYLGHFILQGS